MEDKKLEEILPALNNLAKVLPECWGADTSSDPESWNMFNRCYGQCAVTALLVQDYCGGKIVNCTLEVPRWGEKGKSVSYYFNKIGNLEIDLTKHQFPEDTEVPKGVDKKKDFPTTRDYVLFYEPTAKRYELLKERVEKELAKL
ncbi:MAG: hypothetical protein KKA65_02700 [Nanoarchaeota archaeon]|nr:hypothetical protein [Nanoarchaeota archaeon]MBU4351453.1 hypothetical protein [Nanoarchaeota archaeon]MBU4456387.1 hypothetical protein [Nanoarchaeota archaeon]MCG2720158.1 hypothetical protein [Nanoarchaeota archaeon]